VDLRICCRCFTVGDYKPAGKFITTSTHEEFDLCESCFSGIIDYINEGEPKRRRTRKAEDKGE